MRLSSLFRHLRHSAQAQASGSSCYGLPLAGSIVTGTVSVKTQRVFLSRRLKATDLNEALDEVRRREYARLQGEPRRFIKGNRYTLLAHRENLDLDGRAALKALLAANKRLNTAYLLKESFGQLWDYQSEAWARKFFENWKDALKWQRLAPFEKFAQMIERHWDGIVSYCKPDHKVSLGCVEGLNNTIRVIQRKAYGFRDEEYLGMKIITHFLPPLPDHAKITHTNPR